MLSLLIAPVTWRARLIRSAMGLPRRRILGRFPVAGFRYHDGPAVVHRLRRGEEVRLVPEPSNVHDPFAVAIVTGSGAMLGYIPRAENRTISRLLDQGERIRCRIVEVRPEAEAWRSIEVDVWWEDSPGMRW